MTFTTGQTVRFVNNDHGYDYIVVGHTYEVLSVRDGGRSIKVQRDQHSITEGWYRSDAFEAVTDAAQAVDFAPGVRVEVINTGHGNHNVNVGDKGVIVRLDSQDYGQSRIAFVTFDCGKEHSVYVRGLKVEGSAPEVTLDEYRVNFMVQAYARGQANGGRHVQEVKDTLDDLARQEFMSPSKTIEEFQKRVVAMAFEAKVKYNWCPEPEDFLRSIGLGHLLPVKKVITVTIEVEVTGEDTWTRQQWRDAARTAVGTVNGTVRIPVSTNVRNSI